MYYTSTKYPEDLYVLEQGQKISDLDTRSQMEIESSKMNADTGAKEEQQENEKHPSLIRGIFRMVWKPSP